MTDSKPEWLDDNWLTYHDIVNSWGYEVLDSKSFGSYQGDLVYIFRDGGQYGLSIIGYGSCSGCDALQAATSWIYNDDANDDDWTEFDSLCLRLHRDIHWESSLEALSQWVLGLDRGNEWWLSDSDITGYIYRKLRELQ